MTYRDTRRSTPAAMLPVGAAMLCSAAAPAAEPALQHQTCSIGSSLSTCPQLNPAQGKLISIDIAYSATSVFALGIVGEKHTTTTYDVWTWQELDTKGGDIGSFYINSKGTIEVAPSDIQNPTPAQITVSGKHSETVTDPLKLARFVGTSAVPIMPLAEPATGAGHEQKVGTGTIHQFYRVSSNVGGTLTLNYQPILIKIPKVKLPQQDLPKPPFTVPPNSPKPNPKP